MYWDVLRCIENAQYRKKGAASLPSSDPKGHENLSLQSNRNIGWKVAGASSLLNAEPMTAAEKLSHGLVQPNLRSNSQGFKGEQYTPLQLALSTELWSNWIFSEYPCTASFPHCTAQMHYLIFGEQRRNCAWCGAWKMAIKEKKLGYHKVININKVKSEKPASSSGIHYVFTAQKISKTFFQMDLFKCIKCVAD